MPSFTFVSTANAFVLRGGVPVFVDIRPDTLNLDERADRGRDHAAHQGDRRRCTTPASACEMDAILAIAERHGLMVIEDAAQALHATLPRPAARRHRRTRHAELPRDQERHLAARAARCSSTTPALVERAEIIREKGTNRSRVLPRRGRQVHLGGHRLVLPAERDHRRVPVGAARAGRGDHRAAPAQSGTLPRRRFAGAGGAGLLRRPVVPAECRAQRAHVLPAAR